MVNFYLILKRIPIHKFRTIRYFFIGASIQRPDSKKDTPVFSLKFPATGKLLDRARSGELGNANDYMDEVLFIFYLRELIKFNLNCIK